MSIRLAMIAASDKQFTITITDPDGTPTDLTDWTLRWTAKRRYSDPDSAAVLVKTTEGTGLPGGITIDEYEDGVAVIDIDAADTDPWAQTLVWDLRLTKDDESKIRARGVLEIGAVVGRTIP